MANQVILLIIVSIIQLPREAKEKERGKGINEVEDGSKYHGSLQQSVAQDIGGVELGGEIASAESVWEIPKKRRTITFKDYMPPPPPPGLGHRSSINASASIPWTNTWEKLIGSVDNDCDEEFDINFVV